MIPKLTTRQQLLALPVILLAQLLKSLLGIAMKVLTAVIVVFFAAIIGLVIAKIAPWAGLILPVANLPGVAALVAFISFIWKEAK